MKSIKTVFMLMLVMAVGTLLSACGKGDKTKIRLAEVTHSVFYAPQYVAMELGYFEEEGFDVELILTPGADKVMAAIVSNDVQIGLCGPEAAIYVYIQGQQDYSISFAQLTQRDGSFLMGRDRITNWSWDMLKGKEILGGRKGGVPEMSLEYVLKLKGLNMGQDDPNAEVNVRTDIQFANMAGAFAAGEGDYVTMFEPTATALEKEGKAYVIASIGAEGNTIPFTAYHAKKSYLESNPEIIQKFTKAIYKGQQWTKSHTPREIAELIHPQFQEVSLDDLTIVMKRYADIQAWAETPYFEKEGFERLMDVMQLAKELPQRAPYDKVVNTEFASKVISK